MKEKTISVKTELPNWGEIVWVKHTHGLTPAKAWVDHNGWWWAVNTIGEAEYFTDVFNYHYEDSPITHWMPITGCPIELQNVQASVATEDQSSNEADKQNQAP